MEQIVDFGARVPTLEEEDKYLQFLIDEGLDLLARFQKIGDRKKRLLVMQLVDVLATKDDPVDGAAPVEVARSAAQLS